MAVTIYEPCDTKVYAVSNYGKCLNLNYYFTLIICCCQYKLDIFLQLHCCRNINQVTPQLFKIGAVKMVAQMRQQPTLLTVFETLPM